MMRKLAAILIIAWAFGFFWFAIILPAPHAGSPTEAVAVLTGGKGRIDRGLEVIKSGLAPKMLVSGVDREVKAREFAAEYRVSAQTMACCVVLGYESYDTRSNAAEIAGWIARSHIRSIRLVTSDWHMRRAALELRAATPPSLVIVRDAVPTSPSLRVLFLEYHKFLARRMILLWG